MDFAASFSCSSLDEVETVNLNQTMVTVHVVVVYYKEHHELKHISYCVHFLIPLRVSALHAVKPDLKTVHYFTDSPSRQYGNIPGAVRRRRKLELLK
ncbi:hypothetical protein MAR_029107 [Mya arenaria]|uniref:Uncharacterized protein n=1 Tax=Mya arenaria TaxID=6604 RepID=A0ABY7DFI8_MYAAR|nr:hypothetical protein MAR_029107 [Mya arenaria]